MRGPFARKNWGGLHERCAGVLRRYSEKAKFCRNGWWTLAEPAATIPEHLTFRRQRRLWLPEGGRALRNTETEQPDQNAEAPMCSRGSGFASIYRLRQSEGEFAKLE